MAEGKGEGSKIKVFLHNLPYGYEKKDIEKLFDEHKLPEPHAIDVMRDRGGKARGMYILEMVKQEEVDDVIAELNEVEVEGRRITAREDRGSGYVHPASIEKRPYGPPGEKGKGKGWGKGDYGRGRDDYDRRDRDRDRRRRDDSRDRSRRDRSRGLTCKPGRQWRR